MRIITFKKGVFTSFLFMTVLFFSSASIAQEKSSSSRTSYGSAVVAEFKAGNYQVKGVTLPIALGVSNDDLISNYK